MVDNLVASFYVFILATFLGFEVIRRVSPLLHTPLMSLTNAISAISLVGSIVLLGEQRTTLTTVLGAVAVTASMINVVSGFLITDRMLRMFKQRPADRKGKQS
ncbi:MAG: NAD(P) transhydrogenase subunit alpha [Chthonomonadales bacterium]|nr:NAD(P) transhydrogenase subunit alpha [Chthonomonadales bacterium]